MAKVTASVMHIVIVVFHAPVTYLLGKIESGKSEKKT
jgi:hypothetical protein